MIRKFVTMSLVLALVWATVAAAGAFFQEDFRSGTKGTLETLNASGACKRNTIVSLDSRNLPSFGTLQSKFVLRLVTCGGVDHASTAFWFAHKKPDLWTRMYVWIPKGYRAYANFANSLKFWTPQAAKLIKLGEFNGQLSLQLWALQGNFRWTHGDILRPGIPISRGQWHYLEVRGSTLSGNDRLDFWLDADARTSPPTGSITGITSPLNSFNSFQRPALNQNWSGSLGPVDGQEWYATGLAASDMGPIGDTLGLLSAANPPPPPSPAPPPPTPPAGCDGLNVTINGQKSCESPPVTIIVE